MSANTVYFSPAWFTGWFAEWNPEGLPPIGEFPSLRAQAESYGIWTPEAEDSAAYVLQNAMEALRAGLFGIDGTSGILSIANRGLAHEFASEAEKKAYIALWTAVSSASADMYAAIDDAIALERSAEAAAAAEANAIAAIPTRAPKYIGRYNAVHPSIYYVDDWWLVYDTDDTPIQRGVYYSNAGTPERITLSSAISLQAKLINAIGDIGWAERNGYGVASDYGVDSVFESLAAVSAFFDKLFTNILKLTAGGELRAGDNKLRIKDQTTAELDGLTISTKTLASQVAGQLYITLSNAYTMLGLYETPVLALQKYDGADIVTYLAAYYDVLNDVAKIALTRPANGKGGFISGGEVISNVSDGGILLDSLFGVAFRAKSGGTLLPIRLVGNAKFQGPADFYDPVVFGEYSTIQVDRHLKCHKIFTASHPSKTTTYAQPSGATFTLKKVITAELVMEINSYTTSAVLYCKDHNGDYSTVAAADEYGHPKILTLAPGDYRLSLDRDSGHYLTANLYCLGVFGSTFGDDIWT